MYMKQNDDGQGTLKIWKFDPSKVRQSLIKMIIVDEVPFSFVEREGFREFVETVCPSVKIPIRFTVAHDIIDYFLEEKKKLKEFFVKNKPRLSFTTDSWTLVQRINYMCLIAHFIYDSWNFHKRIINFIPILSHTGDNIASSIQECLYEWGIEHVMSLTVDNATSNDVAVRNLSIRLPNLLRNGKFLHVRCLAHIMNLIVQEGLKAHDKTIDVIRNAVKYVRQSPARLALFKTCVSERKIESKALLSLDVCTRWNSTCEMLERANKFERAFDSYALKDPNFRKELGDVPDHFHWSYANKIVALLQLYKRKTVEVSCSTYVVAHQFYPQVMDIADSLEEMCTENNNLIDFKVMVIKMKKKFEKYFEEIGNKKMNMLFEFANILDPRLKLELIEFGFRKKVEFIKETTKKNMTDEEYGEMVDKLVDDVKLQMQFLVIEYETLHQTGSSPPIMLRP